MSVWPRAYLLNIYASAIQNGWCEVTEITEDRALSLRQSLYRLRRRSDSSNASFITPDHHLVTALDWEAVPEYGQEAGTGHKLGKMRFVFSYEELDLPPLVDGDGEPYVSKLTQTLPQENLGGVSDDFDVTQEDVILPHDLIASLAENARRKREGES